jgi:hypothetical protein
MLCLAEGKLKNAYNVKSLAQKREGIYLPTTLANLKVDSDIETLKLPN